VAKLAKVCLQLFFRNFQFQTVHRSIGLHWSAVHRLRMATDHSSFHAKFENITEHGLENIFREQLPRSANGRVPRQFLVNVVAQKKRKSRRIAQCSMNLRSLVRFYKYPTRQNLKNTIGSMLF